jgi:hypothetical protein
LRVPSPERGARGHSSSVPDIYRTHHSGAEPNTRDQSSPPPGAVLRPRAHSDSGLGGHNLRSIQAGAYGPTDPGDVRIAFDIRIPSIMINNLKYAQDPTVGDQLRPKGLKIHHDYLLIESLNHYGIPYRLDPVSLS